MRKLILTIIPALLVFISVPCSQAQEQPEFKMPCAEVLKLGLDSFMDVYGKTTDDYSTYGQKQAFSYYVDCRRPDNDRRAAKLSETRREQISAVREALNKLGDSSWSNAYIEAGGGTLYGLASVGAYAVREDQMTKLITLLANSESRQPLARRRANAAVNRARKTLASLASTPDLDTWGAESRNDQLKHYQSNVKEIKDAVAQLVTIIRILPDGAAQLVARRMEAELSAGIDE